MLMPCFRFGGVGCDGGGGWALTFGLVVGKLGGMIEDDFEDLFELVELVVLPLVLLADEMRTGGSGGSGRLLLALTTACSSSTSSTIGWALLKGLIFSADRSSALAVSSIDMVLLSLSCVVVTVGWAA